MKIIPLGDRLVIKADEAASKVGTFFIPDAAKEKPLTGVVQAVGEDINPDKLGKRVLFGKYGPAEINLDGEDLLIVKGEDIMAVIE